MDKIKNVVRNILKKLIFDFCIVLTASVLGFALIIMVYMLPIDTIKANISRGAEVLLVQGSEYLYAGDYKSAILDNETDALILGGVAYKPSSPIVSAVNIPHLSYEGREGMVYSLFAYLHGDVNGREESYSRYWHGYVAILKPFFALLDYSDFRILNQMLQLVLISVFLVLLQRLNLSKFCLALVPMLIFWNPATIGVSLQYSPCFYISMISTLLVLLRYRANGNYYVFFLIVGIATSYFDFLTYPVATLGVPLTFLCVLRARGGVHGRVSIMEILCITEKWCFGYAGMWAMKWILGTLISGENIIADAFINVAIRSSTTVDDFNAGRLYTCFYIIKTSFFKWPYLIMVITVMAIILYIYRNKSLSTVSPSIFFPFILIAILPLVWYFATANHSFIHPRLVYRALGVSIVSLVSGVICLFEKCE